MSQSAMRRAPAPQKIEASDNQDILDACLSLWKDWMQLYDKDLGAKTMRGLAGEGDGFGGDIHDEQRKNDIKIAEATHAMISSLPQIHQWAIKRACSIARVWNFPNADYKVVYLESRELLEQKLKNNICTSVLFC